MHDGDDTNDNGEDNNYLEITIARIFLRNNKPTRDDLQAVYQS